MKEFTSGKHITLIIRRLSNLSGGAERIYCELANILLDNGYRVTCLHYDVKDDPPFYPLSVGCERINLMSQGDQKKRDTIYRFLHKLRVLPKTPRNRLLWDKENAFFMKQIHDYFLYAKPDVAISLMPPANTPTLLASLGAEVKVIAANHNVPEQDYTSSRRWNQNPLDKKLRLQVLDHAAAIHVLFEEFKNWFPEHLRRKITAIPNYVSPDFSQYELRPVRDKLILAVGRLTEVKNYASLIRSWAAIHADFPEWRVLLYGLGPQLKELKALIAEFGLEERFLLGEHRADLGGEYARAAIFCHPALFEGFGLSPAEALYMGIPVIIYSDCTGTNQFVKHGVNGLTLERHAEGDPLAEALRLLMTDEALRLRLASAARASVERFSLDRYVKTWITLIENVLERGTTHG